MKPTAQRLLDVSLRPGAWRLSGEQPLPSPLTGGTSDDSRAPAERQGAPPWLHRARCGPGSPARQS